MRFLDNIKEHWITWRTGSNRNQREWKAWYNANVNWRATDITNMYRVFIDEPETQYADLFEILKT
jgi:hypothetical protein